MLNTVAVSLATLCLLALATSAHAECAWVLWSQANGAPHIPLSAFPSIAECDRELEKYVTSIRASEGKYFGYEVTLGAHRMSAISLKQGTIFSMSCLPDTVDPRGLKGK